MSGGHKRESISLQDLQEWLGALGLEVEPEDERPLPDQLRDGVVLCQLVNRIKPNSVEVVGGGRGRRRKRGNGLEGTDAHVDYIYLKQGGVAARSVHCVNYPSCDVSVV